MRIVRRTKTSTRHPQLVSTLGVAAGTSGLGAVAMLVAMAGRTRLEHAVETVADAAGDALSRKGEMRWD